MRKNKTILTTTTLGLTVAAAIVIASSLIEAVAAAEEVINTGVVVTKKDANIVDAVNNNDDYNAYYKHRHEGGNSTLSATFSIRVTPEHYHIVSWSILWGVFVCSVFFGVYQMHLERKWLKYVQSSSHNNNNKSSSSSSSSNRNSYRFNNKNSPDPEYGSIAGLSGGRTSTLSKSGRLIRASSRAGTSSSGRMSTSKSSASINSSSNPGNLGDEQAVSSGDISRATFRRLLLFAMFSRTIAIPIQIYSDPLWVQLIADTFPVMAYATAWMWLVSFFVQLVGVALGTNPNPNIGGEGITMSSSSGGGGGGGGSSGNGGNSNNTNSTYKPVATIDTVIQITAYTVYALLITTFTVFRRIAAAVLLYALLCCVYATLLGTGLYYCPRLLGLLLPGLGRGSRGSGSADSSPSTSSTATKYYKDPLAIRLGLCTIICLLVFAGRTFCFARKVVQSTGDGSAAMHSGGPYWWFQYGTLEWLPSILILIMIHPKKVITNNSKSGSSNNNNNSNNSNNNDDNPNQQQHQQPPASGRRTPPLHSYLRQDHSGSKNYNKPSSSPSPSAASSLSLFSAVTLPAETSPLLAHTTLASSSSSVNRYGGVGGGDNNNE